MKYLLIKDKKRRVLHFVYEKRRILLLSIIRNLKYSKNIRMFAYTELRKFPRDASISRIHNRCIYTNRPRGIYRKFGLSRLMFRKYIWKGKLIGVRNSSW